MLQEVDELEWRSPENPEMAAAATAAAATAAAVVRDPMGGAPGQQQQQQQQLGGANANANNNIVTNGSVTSVSEISNAVSGDAGPDSRGFPASSFPDVNASSPETATAELASSSSGSAVAASASEGGPVTGLNGASGGAATLGEAGDAAAGDGGEEEEEKDEPPPFLEEFEEVELQVRSVLAGDSLFGLVFLIIFLYQRQSAVYTYVPPSP